MREKKHIDRLFQEKFKDFEVSPNPELWDGINERLHPKKKKRRVIPIWWWGAGGVAAALLLFFALGGGTLFNETPAEDLPIVDVEMPKNIEDASHPSSEKLNSKNNLRLTDDETKKKTLERPENDKQSVEKENSTSILKGNGTNAVAANATGESADTGTKSNSNPSDSVNTKMTSNSTSTNKSSTSETGSEMNSKSNEILKTSNTNEDAKMADNTNLEEGISKDKMDSGLKEPSIEEAIAEAKNINEEEKEKLNRWSIAPSVAPVYFNSLSGGSAIDSQFNDNDHQSDVTMSYGIAGAYNINPRLKIKVGVNRVEFNQTTKNVLSSSSSDFTARTEVAGIENITLNSSENDVTLFSASNIARSSAPEALNTTPTGNLDQRFGFIEVPVAIEYRLVDKKLGVNLSGGFSTFFLNANEIYADLNGNNTLIGSANNLNDTSYSANFGVGFDYGLSKKINVNLEPMFKYQINTFNNTSGDFRPFFIGVYTGLSFKF